MKTSIKAIGLAIALQLLTKEAIALGKISRACPVADIPVSMKLPALALFEAIGDAPLGSLTSIAQLTTDEQYNWWILESITTDYGSVRYYLFTENKAYRYSDRKNGYFFEAGYHSNGWADTTSVSNQTLSDSRFQIFFANRGFLYSARAGHKNIVQRWSRDVPAPGSTQAYKDFWKVMGQHYYFDPVTKVVGHLGASMADNCNLGEWGFGDR